MYSEITDLIIRRIEKLCKERKITYYRLAKNSGLNTSTLNSILNGDSKNIKVDTVKKICTGFNISIKIFFDDTIFD